MNQSEIQIRLYRALLLMAAGLSVVCIIGNCISAFPFKISIKWIALFFVSVAAFALSRHKKHRGAVMFMLFLFLIFLFLPFAYMDSGGSNNNALGYIFLLLISVTFLFNGRHRIFLVAGLVAVFMALHALEYYYPGLVMVYSDQKQFIDRMIQIPLLLLVTFCMIMLFSSEYERVNAKLDSYANFDALTGLSNRRVFNRAIKHATEDYRSPAYLALLDVDDFKIVNDRHGHSVGDRILRKLASLLKESCGSGQHIISRWGGDEFAVIFYGEKRDFENRMEQVRKDFQAYAAPYNETTGVSLSIVSVHESSRAETVLTLADRLMYREKKRKHGSRGTAGTDPSEITE